MSIRQYLNTGLQFCEHLHAHHSMSSLSARKEVLTGLCLYALVCPLATWKSLTITFLEEETYIFPVLAKRMPAFRKELELLTQHKQIHMGLDHFQQYLEECQAGKRELRLAELKTLMDEFGTVLWNHLIDEVRQLGAENMRKFWTTVSHPVHRI